MKKLAYGMVALLAAGSAQAELLGAGVGGGIWNAGPSGTVTSFDVEKDAGLSSANNSYLWAYFNHPLPLIPNVRAEFTSTSTSGTGKNEFKFLGNDFATNAKTNLDLDQTDFLLYWGLPLPFVSFNYGFGAKDFKGELSVTSGSTTETSKLNATLPVGYLGADISLPMLPLTFSGNIKTLGSRFNDTTFKARYDIIGFGLKLGAEAGYRTINLNSDDLSNLDIDLSYGGVFAGVTLVF